MASWKKVLFSPRVWMALCFMLGWFASAYLLFEYVTGGPIVCGAAGGCEVVRGSRWAFVGPVPLPAFGVAFYTAMFSLLVVRSLSPWRPGTLRRLTFLGALLGFVESAYLFFVQWLSIKAFCLWCLASAASVTAAFALTWIDRGPVGDERRLHDLYGYVGAVLALALVGTPAFFALVR